MSTTRERNDFINFIIDATQDIDLADKFFSCKTAEEIRDFFVSEGYHDIPLNDCEDILNASKSMHGRGVNAQGEPVDSSVTTKGY